MRRASLLALVFLAACGSSGAEPPSAPPAAASQVPAQLVEPEGTEPEGEEPEPATAPPAPLARLDVAPPADLAAAITARLPTLELVPESCEQGSAPVAFSYERICLVDEATGRTRAMRRVATFSSPAVAAARDGERIVFAVADDGGGATSRYAGRLWRWDLRSDDYQHLIAVGEEALVGRLPLVVPAPFGVFVQAWSISDARAWVVHEGEIEQVRPIEGLLELTVHASGDGVFALRREGQREVVLALRRDGPRTSLERVASYPRAWHLPLAVAFPERRSLVLSAMPHGEATTLSVLEPPSTEVRTVEVAVRRPRELRFIDGRPVLRGEGGEHAVDLASGALSPFTPPPAELARPSPRAIPRVFPLDGDVVFDRWSSGFRLGPAGAARFTSDAEEEPSVPPSGCRCDGDALVCGEDRSPGACAHVDDLEVFRDHETEMSETEFLLRGRYRVDRLEPDYVRITRLRDGARLWVRLFDAGLIAQADDGAVQIAGDVAMERFSLRWGRSLLDAPVTAFAPHRAALERPALVADFFADRALPAADTTLPDAAR